MKDRRTTKPKKKYSKISTQKRLKLVQMVLEEGLTLTKVAKSLHIKRPTAKVILKRYKQKGTFFHKKMAQIKTRESIGSNSQPKIEEKSRENVSIELQPDEDNRPLPEGSALPVRTEQQQADEPIRLLYFYSLFPQYPSFM